MKSKEELNALKKEFEELNNKFTELSKEEMKEVTGGMFFMKENEEGFGCEHRESRRPTYCPNSEKQIKWLMNMYKDAPCYNCKKNYVLHPIT